jgi:hypothetical protein
MTDDLATALRTMAESELPPAMDVERVLHDGRHSRARRRMAAFGGGTAVVATTALAVGVLAPVGSARHTDAAVRPASSTTVPAAVMTTLPPDVNPHDPLQAHWGFGYVPAGMAVTGGAGSATSDYSTVFAYDRSGLRLQVQAMDKPPVIVPGGKNGIPTEKVPATVPGAAEAYWLGYGHGQIVARGEGFYADGLAELVWRLPGGQWLSVTAVHIDDRADWKQQTLKVAAHVVRQDRSLPMPIKLAGGVPPGFSHFGATVTRDNADTFLEYNLVAGYDKGNNPEIVAIIAFKTGGQWKPSDGAPPQDKSTCKDSNGLTVCIDVPDPAPAPLTAIGGPNALLQRITSLGNDPANWTTDVLP